MNNCPLDIFGNQCHSYGTCEESEQCICVNGLQSGWEGTRLLPCCALKGDCNWLAVGLAATALVILLLLVGVYAALQCDLIQSTRLKNWESKIKTALLADQTASTDTKKDLFQGNFSRVATRKDKMIAILRLLSYATARGLLVFTLMSPSSLPNKLARVGNFTVSGALVSGPAIVDCTCGTVNDTWYRKGECAAQLSKSMEPFYYPFILDFFLLLLGYHLQKYFPLSLHNALAPLIYGVVYNRQRTPDPPTTKAQDVVISASEPAQLSPSDSLLEQKVVNDFKCWEKLILVWLFAIPLAGFAVPYHDFMMHVDVWTPCNGVIYGTKDVIMALLAVQAAFGGACLVFAVYFDLLSMLCCWCICRRCCPDRLIYKLYSIGWEKI